MGSDFKEKLEMPRLSGAREGLSLEIWLIRTSGVRKGKML